MQIYITESNRTDSYETIIEVTEDNKFVFSYNHCDHSVKRHCKFCGSYITDYKNDIYESDRCKLCNGTNKVLSNSSFNSYMNSITKAISNGANIDIAFWA